MRAHSFLVFFVSIALQLGASSAVNKTHCRNVPGSPGFPSVAQWNAFNNSISGRLTYVAPSAKYCHSLPLGSCTDEQWESSVFRSMIPGAMSFVRLQLPFFFVPRTQVRTAKLGAGEWALSFFLNF
jgi:hypothetical protein